MGLSKTQKIGILLAIDIAFFLLEIIVGYAVHSLALVADAFHMFNDILSLLVGLWAVRVATNGKTSKIYTYGWQRAETLGALVNGVFLVALCVTIVLEAIQRFVDPPEIQNPKLVLIVGSCGLASNLLGLLLFHEHGHGHGHSHGGHSHSHSSTKTPESAAEEGHAVRRTKSTDGEHTQHGPKSPQAGKHRDSSDSTAITIAGGLNGDGRPSFNDPNWQNTPRRSRRSSASRYAFADAQDIPTSAREIRQSIIQAGSYGGDLYREVTSESRQGKSQRHQSAPEEALIGTTSQASYGTTDQPVKRGKHVHHDEDEHSAEQGHGHGHSHGDLNMRGVFLHVMGDALGNIGVIGSALFIWLTQFSWRFYADPLISLIITVIILCSAIPLCRATSRILLQAVPQGINIDAIRADIEALDHIVSCHHLHVWQLSDTKIVASLHVQIEFKPDGAEDVNVQSNTARELYMRLAKEIHLLLHDHGIDSSTIQPEFCTDSSHRHLVPRSTGESTIVGDADENSSLVVDAAETCLLECDASCGNSISGQCCDPVVAGASGQASALTQAAGPTSTTDASPTDDDNDNNNDNSNHNHVH